MDIRQAAQAIRDSVTMRQVTELYGYQAKNDFICCPFHAGDRTASLRIYDGSGGWHCFGCGKHGSVIDFVMEHEGCNFKTAVHALDRTFGLNLLDDHENVFEASDGKHLQDAMDNFAEEALRLCNALRKGVEYKLEADTRRMMALEDKRADNPEELTADEWWALAGWKAEAEHDEYYRIDRMIEIGEEVKEWRRKARGARSAS